MLVASPSSGHAQDVTSEHDAAHAHTDLTAPGGFVCVASWLEGHPPQDRVGNAVIVRVVVVKEEPIAKH